MSEFRGFNSTEIRALAASLRRSGNDARGVHQSLAGLLTEAAQLMNGKPATTDPLLEPLVGQLFVMPSFFGGPSSMPGVLDRELGDMAGSMERRSRQLDACKVLIERGYTIDEALLFADEDAPREKDITEALTKLRELDGKDFGTNGNREDLEKVQERLEGLTPTELSLFFDRAPAADLKRYNDLINDTDDSGWKSWDHNGLPSGERRDHLSLLLRRLSPRQWAKAQAAFPGMQPGFNTTDAFLDGRNAQSGAQAKGMHWGLPKDPLFKPGSNGQEITAADISQGRFADCWYIASLTSTAQVNPQFIREGIKENPNGTIDVRIWDEDGDKRWVTVTPDLPLDENGDPMTARANGALWPAYYEKAFALVYGGDKGGAPDGREDDERYDREEEGSYGAVEWDHNDKAPPYVTGHEAEGIDNDVASVRERFESGSPVIVSTGSGDSDQKAGQAKWGSTFSTRHVYFVKGFRGDNIVLGNPWGPPHQDIEATPEDYEKFFDDPQALKVPK
ncbi:C2 family cysteine protease [Streptomyces sp. 71268]|uniref:C2 family cysteine protease n=1 Tax=Streptomyces sp. 71268 TaxID=3002640 RepID=UPI0023F86919|nr:C2 family cysteine protease [Streptomyces sp. 71268]WEV28951.1 C2 family cysteine protease [Streptomyces sp. 71268]